MSGVKKRALVVDDNASNLILETDLLDVAGFEVYEAKDATTGIALARQVIPDIIIMDVRLPDMQGYDAAKVIRRDNEICNTPIVFVTASVLADVVPGPKPIPNTGFIGKPINTRTFATEIKEFMVKSRPAILVVDDRANNADLLEALLTPEGYQVTKVSSGAEALEKLSETTIDLMLLDVMMPDMNGFEVARRVRHGGENRHLPIMLVTALHEPSDRVKGIEAGCDDFISKPVDKMELLVRVRNLLRTKARSDQMDEYRNELEAAVGSMTGKLELALETVKRGSLDTIFRLSMAAEYRDDDTGAHIMRVSHYAAAIARQMKFDEKTVEMILYATPMHDLGKIGIPDRILLKSGKLDPEEWETMQRHTIIGAKILRGSEADFLNMAESIALTHHERWDGSGYPLSLSGKQIPIASRIVAVADVFDALTSKRPYKEALSVERSLAIIRESSGGHFDPEVVTAFLAITDEIMAIKNEYHERKAQESDSYLTSAVIEQISPNLQDRTAGLRQQEM